MPEKYKGHKRLLEATICQQNRQPGRKGQFSKNEPGGIRTYKQTNHK